MAGRLIGVVGPSGVGKDSVMRALVRAQPELALVRRVITRAPESGGEDYEPVSEAEFRRRADAGEFCLQWQAHGLHYGIPADISQRIAAGAEMLVNLSRGVLNAAQAQFPDLLVLNITARPETLAARLRGRGREDEAQIALRLSRDAGAFPPGLELAQIDNDGSFDEAVQQALLALYPVRA